MNKGLNGIKNLIWLAAIMLALVALLVGLVFALSHQYYGDEMDGTLVLHSGRTEPAAQQQPDPQPVSSGSLTELPDSQDAGVEYVFNLTFLCDSTLTPLNDYGSSYGGSVSAQLWSASGLSAASASETMIVSPSDGSQITPVNAAMVYQPKRLVIYLGGDALASADEQSFISGYTQLIEDIRSASPDTAIVCCSIGSIAVAYTGSDGLTAELFTQANAWIETVCADTGVYYADLASVLNDDSGYLKAEYAASDGRTLSAAGINAVISYFRFHAGI